MSTSRSIKNYSDLPAPSTVPQHVAATLCQSKIAISLNSYLNILNSLISRTSSTDMELLLLTDQNISNLFEQILTSLWRNATLLHDLLMQKIFMKNNDDFSFINGELIENINLSLEGLSAPVYYTKKKDSKLSLLEIYSIVFEKIDSLLDTSFIYKDDASTLSKRNKKPAAQIIQLDDGSVILGASSGQSVPRPQLGFFDGSGDNSRTAKFSLCPKAIGLGAPFSNEIESVLCSGEPLKKLVSIVEQFIKISPDSLKNPSYSLMEERPLNLIETFSKLEAFISKLRNEPIFAIDVEYHSLRSFRGFSCLIQISTLTEDSIIDALALREKLYLLNIPFGDPSKLKIFHGCYQDLLWLQKDFSVFVAGIFDTFVATSNVLSLSIPSLSLASLVAYFCSKKEKKTNLVMDKDLQLADWRIRPLSQEMIKYARADTYFLLALFVNLIIITSLNSETPKGWIEWSIRESSTLALKLYFPEDEKSSIGLEFEEAISKAQQSLAIPLSAPSVRAFYALWKWRDSIAREEDESLRYVLPTFMMIKIAQNLPSDAQSVLSCCNPVPPVIRQHASDVALLVWKAASDTETVISSLLPESTKSGNSTEVETISIEHIKEYQDTLNNQVNELLKSINVPSTPLINILSEKSYNNLSEIVYSKIENIKSSFSLVPWQLTEEKPNQMESTLTHELNTSLVLSENLNVASFPLEDLTNIKNKKKKNKKKQKIDPLQFINSNHSLNRSVNLSNNINLLNESELHSCIFKNAPVIPKEQKSENVKRKHFPSNLIEAPEGFDSKKKSKKKSTNGLSKSFIN